MGNSLDFAKSNYKYIFLITGAMALIALLEDLPYSYYQILRWIICIVSLTSFFIQYNYNKIRDEITASSIVLYILYVFVHFVSIIFLDDGVLVLLLVNFGLLLLLSLADRQAYLLAFCSLIIAIIFNPIIPFHSDDAYLWKFIDCITGLWFVFCYVGQDLYYKKIVVKFLYKEKLKDAQEIFKSCTEDAEMGDIDAMFKLAKIYSLAGTFSAMARGSCINNQDLIGRLDESIKWLKRIAAEFTNVDARIASQGAMTPMLASEKKKDIEHQCTFAMLWLGEIYQYGYYYSSTSGVNAFGLHPRSNYLSVFHEYFFEYERHWSYWLRRGRIDENLKDSLKWYKQAADLGNEQAVKAYTAYLIELHKKYGR
jgi:hypothetical protein